MRRRYRSRGFLERCRQIQEALDEPALTTDVIVGFPGETEADFQATCRVLREVGFAKIHVFSFSPRQGTSAADLPDRVPPAIVAERRRCLLELERDLSRAYLRRLLGRQLDVLVEGADPLRPGYVCGTSCRYVPVVFQGHAPALVRRRMRVWPVAVADEVLVGRPERELGLRSPARVEVSRWSLPVAES
jgi:threonylcarbamoyladenosine tRNA methylthiotransferase MtaB